MGKLKGSLVLLQSCILGLLIVLPVVCQAQDPGDAGDRGSAESGYMFDAELNRVAGTVTWSQDLPGDYDQNGEVNLADISALILHFGEYSSRPWPFETIQSVLDGDHNGEINLADITTIVLNFGVTIESFELFQVDSPANHDLAKGDGIMDVPYSSSPGNPLDKRRVFEVQVPIGPSPFFYIAAANQAGLVGNARYIHEGYPHTPRLHTPYYGLSWDTGTESLNWYPRLVGDGDQNGEVNISDLTPIVLNFSVAGPFEPGSATWYIDYDGNGIVDMDDVFVILVNYGAQLDGFLFYSTNNPAVLPEPYSYPVLEPISLEGFVGTSGDYLWLRPYLGDPNNPLNVGPPSEFVLVP